mmetsp:Transcript_60085/g.155257  ORF Transcript_60085/g.155257 Transcript_60085/m.155257 type:complete len:297 (-) Transcript_60085:31-921(-)
MLSTQMVLLQVPRGLLGLPQAWQMPDTSPDTPPTYYSGGRKVSMTDSAPSRMPSRTPSVSPSAVYRHSFGGGPRGLPPLEDMQMGQYTMTKAEEDRWLMPPEHCEDLQVNADTTAPNQKPSPTGRAAWSEAFPQQPAVSPQSQMAIAPQLPAYSFQSKSARGDGCFYEAALSNGHTRKLDLRSSKPTQATSTKLPLRCGLQHRSAFVPPPPSPPPAPFANVSNDGSSTGSSSNPQVISVGSVGHPFSCAEACKFSCKPKGCKDGATCLRCHACDWSRHSRTRLVAKRTLRQGFMLQ